MRWFFGIRVFKSVFSYFEFFYKRNFKVDTDKKARTVTGNNYSGIYLSQNGALKEMRHFDAIEWISASYRISFPFSINKFNIYGGFQQLEYFFKDSI